MTRPDFEYDSLSAERRSIIRQTYDEAVATGDENVYFIDGETFFGEEDRVFCTTDGCHPNDLGFYRMANIVEPVIKSILVARYGEK